MTDSTPHTSEPNTLPLAESETAEFKTSLAELKQGLISLVAMLNKHGQGDLWFGVNPAGKPKGFDINEKTLRDVSQAIAAHIEPKLYPEISAIEVQGKTCLRIQAASKQKPFFAYGRAYVRVADEDRAMSVRELEGFILQYNRAALRWDNEPSTTVLSELSESKIRRFLERASLPWDNTSNALLKLDLLQDGKLVNAAKLFFAKTPIQLRCAVFATDTSSTIIDRHDFDGDILELIDEAEKYILKNIHIGMRLEGLRRVDVPEISLAALREAIINAFCHRDWRDPDYIQIAVYKNRVEIRNPGGLFDGLTLEEMRRGNVSHRRNPLIADLFRRIEMVEAWGRGMPLILENAPNVEFREIARLFVTSFERPSATVVANKDVSKTGLETSLKSSSETPRKHQENTKKTTSKPQENSKKTTRKPLENTKQMLLTLIQQQPSASIRVLAEQMNRSQASVRHYLSRLQADNTLRHVGPDKGGYWQVTEQNTQDNP